MKKFRILFLLALCSSFLQAQQTNDWSQLPIILSRIKPPQFPDTNFNIEDYGAKIDGSLSTISIQAAINACHQAGGGNVIVPKGTFLTGALYLKSKVNLYISYGAVLKFSTNLADYLPVV